MHRLTHLPALLVICCFLLALPPAVAEEAEHRGGLVPVRIALADEQFAEAVDLADVWLGASAELGDEALYLKALALYSLLRDADAIACARQLLADHPESRWWRKGRFLLARSLVRTRAFAEAEQIFEEEADRLLSSERKHELAGILVQLAAGLSAEPDPQDPGAKAPDHAKAYALYQQALAMEIGRDLRDAVMFELARSAAAMNDPGRAIQHYREYLSEYDPDWTGAVGSVERRRGQKRENPPAAGAHVRDARYRLAQAQLVSGQSAAARQNLEDLLAMLATDEDGEEAAATKKLAADATWGIVRSYSLAGISAEDLDRGVKAARDYLRAYPGHPHGAEAARLIALAYRHTGRSDEAVDAFEALARGEGFQLPVGEAAEDPLEGHTETPAQLLETWLQEAVFAVGEIRFSQGEYLKAIASWQGYIREFPNGPQWSDAQRRIIDARYQIALVAVGDDEDDGGLQEAERELTGFLEEHPLDGRAPEALFLIGQLRKAQGDDLLEADRPGEAVGPLGNAPIEGEPTAHRKAREAYARAIREWAKLISKYPGREESGAALYRTGMLQEERLGDLEAALLSYRQLTWGSWAARARARIAAMTQKRLLLATERTFRTGETARVTAQLRNIEKLTVSQYFLDPEAYFRKTHAIGGVEELDIALIQPDYTWEVKVDGYAKYQPMTVPIDIPFDEDRPGVCVVHVTDDELESTTLVLRSNLELVTRTSRRELLAYVQDMVQTKPAGSVTVLVSDGKEVIATGQTGADGVWRDRIDELETLDGLQVFATRDGHVAASTLSLSGLGFSQGLARKGYLYTDRPAYQPGQRVEVRGIIRDVADGAYVAPAGAKYLVSLQDAGGRLLAREEVVMSEFGSFTTAFDLAAKAPLGTYNVIATHAKDTAKSYSTQVVVQPFVVRALDLSIDFDHEVYYRGEKVLATVSARYSWGQPLAGTLLRVSLPDGRLVDGRTDDSGELAVELDTQGMTPGQPLWFSAEIVGEDVRTQGAAMLARLGFDLKVKASQEVVLAGEAFDLTARASTPAGEPTAQKLRVTVLRRVVTLPDPVLDAIPWRQRARHAHAEVTVAEHELSTDASTGAGTLRLTLEKGGAYTVRVAGEDRFEQTVSAQTQVTVSDDDDETRLRIFTDTDTLKVGQPKAVRLHSRLPAGLALLTWEGETILAHEVRTLSPGENEITLDVGHQHFPNFALSATAIDGRKLRLATKRFAVERKLIVSVKPMAEVAAPGADGKVEISVTDHLGKPVAAELSLALVEEGLYALFPDGTPDIVEFFQKDAYRNVDFRADSSAGFAYAAKTRSVSQALIEERDRLVQAEQVAQELFDFAEKLNKEVLRESEPGEPALSMGYRTELYTGQPQGGGGADRGMEDEKMERFRRPIAGLPPAKLGLLEAPPGAADEDGGIRREAPGGGWWVGSVVTDADGKATVELPLPGKATRWRLTARGVTPDTLVGDDTAHVITREDFFAEIQTPDSAVEGDQLRVRARVHNGTDFAGVVQLTLTVTSGEKSFHERKASVNVAKNGTAEHLFASVDVPAVGQLTFTLTAVAGDLEDAVARDLPVRPWGIELADTAGGVASGSAAVALKLPGGRKYGSRWLSVEIAPDVNRAVLAMALDAAGAPAPAVLPEAGSHRRTHSPSLPQPAIASSADQLLAAASGVAYADATAATGDDRRRLVARARALVGAQVLAQDPQGNWNLIDREPFPWAETSRAYWGLSAAATLGIDIDDNALRRAETGLRNAYQNAQAADHEARAIVLHALSTGGKAEFKLANSLYRDRQSLSDLALAYAALSLANLDRKEMAQEMLTVLEGRAKETEAGGRKLAHWSNKSRIHPWLNRDVATTAITLLALVEVTPDSPRVQQAVDYLLDVRGCGGWPADRGLAVAALAAHFARGTAPSTSARLTVRIGDTVLGTAEARGQPAPQRFEVPEALIADGQTIVRFDLEGSGTYAYSATLRGFTDDWKNLGSLPNKLRVRHRRYYHEALRYRDRPISAASTSPVTQAELGQHIRVEVDLYNTSFNGTLVIEEPLPAGATLVPGSLTGRIDRAEVQPGRILLFVSQARTPGDYGYELVGHAPGSYRVLPTILRDAADPSRLSVGSAKELQILGAGEKSTDPYKMNDAERYALGTANFADGRYGDALEFLWPLFDRRDKYQEREVARMLLWIHTTPEHADAARVVAAFELLSVRHPELTIPFDRILEVGKAYRKIGEHERAWLVFRATIDSSFLTDSRLSAVLQDLGQLLGSIAYQDSLWWQYPDSAQVEASYFALSQLLYEKAPQAADLAREERHLAGIPGVDTLFGRKPTRAGMLAETIRYLQAFRTLYPTSPLADDAAFSLANAFLDLEDYQTVVDLSLNFANQYESSEFSSSFQYMTALGHFWMRSYDPALQAARIVADGDSKDRDFARYILGQIHHARGNPPEAIEWYSKVAKVYPDAREAIDYFEDETIAIEEVTIVAPGDPAELTVRYKNIPAANLQVYRVDLMKLYLLEKNLSNITSVNLAGIKPQLVRDVPLGDGKDFADKEETVDLKLTDEGAYLVICRGESLFTSGLVLITPLTIDVQEDPHSGRIRVNLQNEADDTRPASIHVKAIGSADQTFKSGETDLRGIYVADGIHGTATVIAREGDDRYAFYRGTTHLGASQPQQSLAEQQQVLGYPVIDYSSNISTGNRAVQIDANKNWDALRRSGNEGVQIKDAR